MGVPGEGTPEQSTILHCGLKLNTWKGFLSFFFKYWSYNQWCSGGTLTLFTKITSGGSGDRIRVDCMLGITLAPILSFQPLDNWNGRFIGSVYQIEPHFLGSLK